MNRSAEPALRSLLPTHNGPFPPQLTELAGSLLAQSRHRASTLKADEEIARSYACAHIACDRLKTSLNLPPIEPRPPIQPRLYKRLYTHLDTILAPTPGARASAAALRIEQGNSLSSPAQSAANTPRRTQAGAPAKTGATPSKTAAGQPTPRKTAQPAAPTSQFPPWVRPTVRYICHELGHPQLAPTIAAGLAAIHREVEIEAKEKKYRPKKEKTEKAEGQEGENKDEEEDESGEDEDDEDMTEWLEDSLTALVAALYLYCMTSWREHHGTKPGNGPSSGLDERQFQLDERAILCAFEKVRGVVGARDESAWDGWLDLQKRTFRDALVVVSKHQWLQSDWYQDIANLQVSSGDGVDGADGALSDEERGDGEGDDGDYGGVSIPTKVWRADSMFQARYDFLSEAKQQDYDAWRTGMLEEIAGLQEAQHQPQPMEVDS
ncbi:hypothetical protein Sste5346_001997 [Sporothrix stenoceras]|uniref:ORC6 first cyclin-like domain-containing protein n=1 Tax=Sporothrix stenoceras TaxID=5173 RepID=A0ABR3ZJR4_9PEZI